MKIGDKFLTNVVGWENQVWTVIDVYTSKYSDYPIVVGRCGIAERDFRPDEIVVQYTPSNMSMDEIRLLTESIVSCINEGQLDGAKALAQAIIAGLSPVT